MATNDGGCAFPCHRDVNPDGNQSGMTLRDYFAAKAMQGWMATYGDTAVHPCSVEHPGVGKQKEYAEEIARCSYAIADAMLAARMNGGAA